MAGQPHDKTHRTCSDCGKVFEKSSYFGSIIEKEGKFLRQRIVCRVCHNIHHSKNE